MRGSEVVIRDRGVIEASALTPRGLILVGFGWRRTFGYSLLPITLVALLAVILLPAKYESQTSILVHRERVDPPLTAEQTGTLQQIAPALTQEDINSEVGLLQSQHLLETVVIACELEDRLHPP